MDAQVVLRTSDLTKVFGGRKTVDTLNLSVRQGEVYGFLGPNGAGKSTTIRMIVGLLPPSCGHIELFGENVGRDHRGMRRRIGVVEEQPFVYDDMTAREYLGFFAEFYGVPRSSRRRAELLERLELAPFLELLARDFSHGMKKKLSLVRALQHTPDLIILDEPVSNLDPNGIRQVREILEDERRAGRTIVVSSHILSEVERTADRVGILHHGKLLLEDSIDVVRRMALHSELVVELAKPVPGLAAILARVKDVGAVRVSENSITLQVDDGVDLRAVVARTIADSGGLVIGMQQRLSSLEDAFVQLTEALPRG
jgi:ABC-type multidrug transport system ATPase subunit